MGSSFVLFAHVVPLDLEVILNDICHRSPSNQTPNSRVYHKKPKQLYRSLTLVNIEEKDYYRVVSVGQVSFADGCSQYALATTASKDYIFYGGQWIL